jgi:hypothetical protein
MKKKKRHPVWDVYDEYRTTLFHVKQHRLRIDHLKRFKRWTDIALAVFTPSSAITSFLFWQSTYGKLSWNILISCAAVMAIAKPLLKTDEEIQQLIRSLGGYTMLLHELDDLRIKIRQEGSFNESVKNEFARIRSNKAKWYRYTTLITLSKRQKDRLFNEVLTEAPVNRFFVPEEG